MEYQVEQTKGHILCCLCGVAIPANPANMCVNCIRSQVDISDGISKQLNIQWCRTCGKYLNPPQFWAFAELESRELLSICLKKIKGLSKVKLVDANFIWTEPHSRRLKVKLTIQKEVFNATILQQSFVVEFTVQAQMCPACQTSYTPHTWKAVAQVRQKVPHKRTFLWLEQLLLKYQAHSQALAIKEATDGIDFFFAHKSHSSKFVDFVSAVTPCRTNHSQELVSYDEQNGCANYKFTMSVEIAPICRDDLVYLPPKVAMSFGNISPLLLCYRVSSQLSFVDPFTLQGIEMSSSVFWKHPFKSLAGTRSLTEYIVLDIEPVQSQHRNVNSKFVLADAQVARVSDFGVNDNTYYVRTHLGHLLNPGDNALGYDIENSNYNDSNITVKASSQLPSIVLVKKSYPDRPKGRKRHWKLKKLDIQQAETSVGAAKLEEKRQQEYEQFLQELEEDRQLRAQINLFKDKSYAAPSDKMVDEGEQGDDEEYPQVGLEELLEEMTLADEDDTYQNVDDEEDDDDVYGDDHRM